MPVPAPTPDLNELGIEFQEALIRFTVATQATDGEMIAESESRFRAAGVAFNSALMHTARKHSLVAANDNKPIKATPFVLRDPALIPPREFLFGRHYARRYLSATFGAGGGGKSAHSITEQLSMVTGRPLLGGTPFKPLRVWGLNLEDPAVEIERRFAAAALHFGVTAEQIGGRLFTDSGRDQEFVVMKLDGRNTKVCEPVVRQIIAEISARQIDVLVVDPFISTHEVEENDNSRIQQVAALWVRIADESDCSVELVHHITKGNLEVTADSGRGAGALKDKARSVRVINPMTETQAAAANIAEVDAPAFFRVDFGKANLISRTGQPAWRHFASVKLGNGKKSLTYQGDEVGVVEAWEWPTAASLVEDVPPELLAGIKARIGAGNFRESEQSVDWAGHLVGELLGLDTTEPGDKKRVKRMLGAWVSAGEFAIEMRPDARRIQRKHIVPLAASPPQEAG